MHHIPDGYAYIYDMCVLFTVDSIAKSARDSVIGKMMMLFNSVYAYVLKSSCLYSEGVLSGSSSSKNVPAPPPPPKIIVPERIRVFDESGPMALEELVGQQCSSVLLAADTSEALGEALDSISKYIEAFRKEVKLGDGNTRYDVLAIGLVEVNRLLTARLAEAVSEVT